jgi:PKD repeat protein
MRKIILFFSILFLWTCGGGGSKAPTEPVEPAPVSNFTATPTSGLQPLEVVFTSTATGTIASYAWNVDADTDIEGTAATYTHTYTDAGTYGVTLTVTGPGGSNPKTVADMITVTSAAPTPTTATTQTTQEDGSTTISLTATDPNGQTVTFAITTDPTNGTATLSGTDITYTPNANFYGTDSVDYTASNGTYTSDPVTITITVTGEDDGNPTTNDVSATTDEDTAVTVNLDATEIDGDNYSFSIVSQPSNGTLGSINGNQVEYTPNANWNGTDTFTFEATDDRTSRRNVATATITVNAVNDAPEVSNVSASTNSLQSFNSESVEINLQGIDVEGDELTFSIVSDVSNGSTSLSGSTITYTPNANYDGTDTFTYKANDGQLDSDTASGTITVTDINPAISFSASPLSGTKNLRVVFTNNSTDYSSILWDFGDGTTSTEDNPSHVYTSTGSYDIIVTLDSDLGSTSQTFEDYITVNDISLPALIVDSKYNYTSSGSNVTIQLKVLGVTDLTSAQMVLNYSSSDLTLNSIVAGEFLEGNTAPMFISEIEEDSASNINTLKVFTSTLSNNKPSATGDGVLAILNFTIDSSTQDDIISILSFDDISSQIMLDINGSQMTTQQTVNGYFINE